ncbi:MAG: flavin reductase family protein [Litoreibacter sp.]|nr:flavin reductase family protein [Litoreibacter sp.]
MTLRTQFLDAMSGLVSSVNIVTTDGPAAGRAGATVSAMTSVSADGDAPTLLVCLHHEASAAPAILENRCFCVNVLAADQAEIANVFAGRAPSGGDKFSVAAFNILTTGAPALSSALASFDCTLLSDERIGTHHVMIGAVRQISKAEGTPLLYGNRGYQTLA